MRIEFRVSAGVPAHIQTITKHIQHNINAEHINDRFSIKVDGGRIEGQEGQFIMFTVSGDDFKVRSIFNYEKVDKLTEVFNPIVVSNILTPCVTFSTPAYSGSDEYLGFMSSLGMGVIHEEYHELVIK